MSYYCRYEWVGGWVGGWVEGGLPEEVGEGESNVRIGECCEEGG